MRIMIRVVTIGLLGAFCAMGQDGAPSIPEAKTVPAATGESVSESLILLQYLLREVVTKTKLDEKYAACNRASGIYGEVSGRLTPEQRRTWRGRLAAAFRRLPLPEEVVGVTGLRFHRVATREGSVYVTQAVPAGLYASFLTDRKILVDDIREQFYEMQFLQAEKTVTAADRNKAVSGLSQRAAEAYRVWLAEQESARMHLPKLRELPPSLRRSLWVSDPWKEPDPARAELYRMYGGRPVTLLDSGKPVAEFPEAVTPGVHLHIAMGADDARRFYLRTMAAAGAPQ